MDCETALQWIEHRLAQQGLKKLNDLEREVFRGIWQGLDYKDIYQKSKRVSLDHLMRNVGPKLLKRISVVVGEKVSKLNCRDPIERAYRSQLNPSPQSIAADYIAADHSASPLPPVSNLSPLQPAALFPDIDDLDSDEADSSERALWNHGQGLVDWGSAPEVSLFCERTREIEQLEQWIQVEGCRLITLYGIPGAGKTALAVTLVERLKESFERVVWRSLHAHPPLATLLSELLSTLTGQSEIAGNLTQLTAYLLNHRCLIVLDDLETLFQPGHHDGSYQQGYENYSTFLNQMARVAHQSCFLLCSREVPLELHMAATGTPSVRSLHLDRVGEVTGRQILEATGSLQGSEGSWSAVLRYCEGNPFVLQVVSRYVQTWFAGNLETFLSQLGQQPGVLGEVNKRLEPQFQRLSEPEQQLLSWLVANPGPVTVLQVMQTLPGGESGMAWTDVLNALSRRGFIEIDEAYCFLHPLIDRYLAGKSR